MITFISTGVNQLHRKALDNTVQRLNLDKTADIADKKIIVLVGTKNVIGNILKAIFSKHYIIPYFTGLGRLYTDFGFLGRMAFCLMIILVGRRKQRKFIVENAQDRNLILRWTQREVTLINGSGFSAHLYKKKLKKAINKRLITIGYMSRFGASKCTDQIIKLIGRLPDGYKMVIAGEDIKGTNYSDQFYQIARTQDSIEMVGFLQTPEEVSNFFLSIDVFLYPSVREGLPITLLEAIYFRVPFLTTKVAGCIDLAKRFDFPTCLPENFGEQSNHLNIETWGKYTPHWKVILDEFSAPTVEKQLEYIFRKALFEIQASR